MKKTLSVIVLLIAFMLPSTVKAKGGAGPCLATCIFADTRIGLEMNEDKKIDNYDWIRFGGNFIAPMIPVVGGPLGMAATVYTSYKNGYEQAGAKGCCVGYIWGNRPGRMFKDYKLRSKEVMSCIPVVGICSYFSIMHDAYKGKTLTEIIKEENLKR